MIVVLIWWKIWPTAEAEQSLMIWWSNHEIDDRSQLFGEFLSQPQPLEDLNIPSGINIEQIQDLQPESGRYRVFVNVGIWKDWDSFVSGPGQYIDDSRDPEPFEAAKRSRTVLAPQRWRLGDWDPELHISRNNLDS